MSLAEDAVEHERVGVDVELEAASEALDQALLTAVIPAVDVMARLGLASTTPLTWTRTSTLGGMAAALAAGKLLGLPRVAQVCARNAARIFRLRGKGTLVPGSDADLIVVNLDAPGRIDAARNHSGSRFSPYDGFPVTARVEAAVLRGEAVVRDGRVVVERRGRALQGAAREA